MRVRCSQGYAEVEVGTRFTDHTYGGDWEVVRFTDEHTYGPGTIGGTPVIACKQISGTRRWDNYLNDDGTVDWCGDSIAASILLSSSPAA